MSYFSHLTDSLLSTTLLQAFSDMVDKPSTASKKCLDSFYISVSVQLMVMQPMWLGFLDPSNALKYAETPSSSHQATPFFCLSALSSALMGMILAVS